MPDTLKVSSRTLFFCQNEMAAADVSAYGDNRHTLTHKKPKISAFSGKSFF